MMLSPHVEVSKEPRPKIVVLRTLKKQMQMIRTPIQMPESVPSKK